jgi:hypothetical protein
MKLQDYLHLYLGCEVECKHIYDGFRAELVAVNNTTSFKNGLTIIDCINLNAKPILRPLSDMTDEEYSEFNNIPDDVYRGGRFNVLTHQGTCTKWLLSKQFDLFGLIEAGLAIDKTKEVAA